MNPVAPGDSEGLHRLARVEEHEDRLVVRIEVGLRRVVQCHDNQRVLAVAGVIEEDPVVGIHFAAQAEQRRTLADAQDLAEVRRSRLDVRGLRIERRVLQQCGVMIGQRRASPTRAAGLRQSYSSAATSQHG